MFNYENAAEKQQKRFEGEWKNCRRSGCRVLMVPPSHPDFKKKLSAFEREYRVRNGLTGRNIDKPIPQEEQTRMFSKAVAHALIRDWEEVSNNAGAQSYSADLAFVFLTDALYDDFHKDIGDLITAMSENELEEKEEVAAIEKNS